MKRLGLKKKETFLKFILEQELQKARKKNPRYSLRALAQRLRVSPATLSRLLTGKSNLSKAMARHLVENLQLGAEEKALLLQAEHDPYIELPRTQDLEPVIRHWYYSAIMGLAETKAFKADPAWIAKRLSISAKQAQMALSHLEKIGFLKRNGERLVPVDIAFSTTEPIKVDNQAILLDKVELLRRHILDTDPQLTDFSDIGSIIMATGPRKIPEAKVRLKKFRRGLAKYLDAGEKEEVYLIFTQLIPLSKLK